jgi:drug/metabolite transporter (DMT)-like permease
VALDTKENPAGPVAALLAVQLLFGSLPVTAKLVLIELPAISLVGLRVAITTVILVAFQIHRRRIWLKYRSDYWRLAGLGFFGVVLNQMFSVVGLSLTAASNASLLIVTIPVFTAILGFIVGMEKITIAKVAGIALALAGAVILIDPRNASFSSHTTLGDALIVLNSLAFAIYVVTSKDVVTRNGAFRSMMWVFVFSGLVCTPLALISISSVGLASISVRTWLLVAYISIFATAAPYLLNAYAIVRVSPAVLAVFIYLQPLIGFLLAAIFLGEALGVKFLVSTICIFVGVFLVSRRPSGVPASVPT